MDKADLEVMSSNPATDSFLFSLLFRDHTQTHICVFGVQRVKCFLVLCTSKRALADSERKDGMCPRCLVSITCYHVIVCCLVLIVIILHHSLGRALL